MNKIFSYLKTF